MVPWNPQPLVDLQGRYGAALEELYDQRDPACFGENRPGNKAVHVFDSPDGLRLIISRERTQTGKEGVHISASLQPATKLYEETPLRIYPGEYLKELALERWRAISGSVGLSIEEQRALETTFLGFSTGKGVPHWFIEGRP